MKNIISPLALLFVAAAATAQTREIVANPLYKGMHPLAAQIIAAQNEPSGASKTSAVSERLAARTRYSYGGDSYDSTLYYYSGNRSSDLDLKTNKGYLEKLDFFSYPEIILPDGSSVRKKYILSDSSKRFHRFPFGYVLVEREYNLYTAFSALDSQATMNSTSQGMNPYSTYKLSYNSLQLPTTYKSFFNSGQEMTNNQTTYSFYDNGNNLIRDSFISSQPGFGEGIFERDAQGLLIKFTSQNGVVGTPAHINYTITFNYDNQNRLTSYLEANNTFYSYLQTYTYQGGNFPIKSEGFPVNGSIHVTEYFLNASTNELDSLFTVDYDSTNHTYTNKKVNIFTYNAYNHLTDYRTNVILDGTDSITNNTGYRFYYEEYFTSITDNAKTAPVIYPNPVTDALHFSTDNTGKTYSLCDMQGRIAAQGIVSGNRIETRALLPGLYVLILDKTEKVLIQKK